mgnify:CR=1 FL=1
MPTRIKERLERLERLANPMLVRQMYQSLHSRKFLGALWLMLLVSLLTYMVVYMASSGGESVGGTMFSVFALVLFLAATVVLPYMAFSDLVEEVNSRTIELIQITCMGARSQVRGRLQAALSRLLLLYSVIGPFAVVAFLFGGVGVGAILLTLYTLLVLACLAVSVGIFFAALTSVKNMRHMARWLYLGVLIFTLLVGGYNLMGVLGGLTFGRGMGLGTDALAYVVVTGVEGALLSWFLCAAAANLLTFEANKSSGRTRFILLLMVASAFGFSWLVMGVTGDFDEGSLILVEVLSALFLAGCSMVWLTGARRVPATVRRKLQNRGVLYRLLRYPFVDGPGGGAIYMLLAGMLILAGVLPALAVDRLWEEEIMCVPLILALAYGPYFSSCTWGITRMLPRRYRNPLVRRGLLLGLGVCHAFIAVLWFAASLGGGGRMGSYAGNPVAGLFPLVYLPSLLDDGGRPLVVLSGLFLVVLVGLVPHVVIAVVDLGRHLNGDYD